jgi:spoIIIJ-associated protein
MQSKQQIIESLINTFAFSDCQVKYVESDTEYQINISLPQEESGVLIGFRGEKIDALQYICTIILNHDAISYKPVNLDINDYRLKRQQQIIDLADSAAKKATESGREILLPPMPANERRLVHMHLSQSSSVSTYSEGEGASRRLVVRPQE